MRRSFSARLTERLEAGDRYDVYETIETFCDIQAMADEFNEGSCRGFYEKVWKKKYVKYFSDDYNWFSTTIYMENLIFLYERRCARIANERGES